MYQCYRFPKSKVKTAWHKSYIFLAFQVKLATLIINASSPLQKSKNKYYQVEIICLTILAANSLSDFIKSYKLDTTF